MSREEQRARWEDGRAQARYRTSRLGGRGRADAQYQTVPEATRRLWEEYVTETRATTHCVHGHPRSVETSYLTRRKDGRLAVSCRICQAFRAAEVVRRRRKVPDAFDLLLPPKHQTDKDRERERIARALAERGPK